MATLPEHLWRFPCMRPWIGSEYHESRILIVGESHYMPDGSTINLTPGTWYSATQETLTDCERAYIHTVNCVKYRLSDEVGASAEAVHTGKRESNPTGCARRPRVPVPGPPCAGRGPASAGPCRGDSSHGATSRSTGILWEPWRSATPTTRPGFPAGGAGDTPRSRGRWGATLLAERPTGDA